MTALYIIQLFKSYCLCLYGTALWRCVRNVRWPRSMLPLVSHGQDADWTDGQTDRRTRGRYLTLSARSTLPA